MTINTDQLLESILDSLDRIDYVKSEDIPDIQLYMDQVTTFMDSHLASTRRYPSDKILTKTMINNYAKNHLLPPPEKKKYSREHMLLMLFIYYFKSFLSITDIQTLMEPLTGKYFQKEDGYNLESIYNEVMELEKSQVSPVQYFSEQFFRCIRRRAGFLTAVLFYLHAEFRCLPEKANDRTSDRPTTCTGFSEEKIRAVRFVSSDTNHTALFVSYLPIRSNTIS